MAKYTINIPKPCSEDWNQMTPLEKGRHCAVCEKTILDFSNYTKQELIQHIKQEGKICGRVPAKYLDIELNESTVNRGIGLRGLVAATINLLVLTTATSTQAHEQVVIEHNSQESQDNHTARESKLIEKEVQSNRLICGQVTDTDGVFIPGVSISIKELNLHAVTNLDGYFQLELPESHPKTIKIEFQFIGMETLEVKVKAKDSSKFLQVELKDETNILGGLAVVKSKKKWSFF
ncbi:carboxypeptidase-like regulatory domain-containing protein [Myroides odoratus]|uniref:TonB-linked outer membrane protein, SusC/RagA family n=1 Tax=Myroides odoratus TaxID=256 RepID=A0A378U4Z8_MYROD|nr:carboxypeptidase-like regulatory domain-containing protein [Myroides odoratus]QQU03074.1 carboxypeptidase-like regulatory domain-containing protein [Myroides odoratus]STZ69684.1 TonB-linked outer membrane protein, SusC/RagA family [Myroides odoratus]